MLEVTEQATKTVRMRPTLHQKVALTALVEGREIKDIVDSAVTEYLAQRPTVHLVSSPAN